MKINTAHLEEVIAIGIVAVILISVFTAVIAETTGVVIANDTSNQEKSGEDTEIYFKITGDAVQLWNKSVKGLDRGYPAGDLNGDGILDVISEIEDADNYKIMAFRGTDGSKNWETHLGNLGNATEGSFHSMLIEDVNGDGLLDIIAYIGRWTRYDEWSSSSTTEIVTIQGTNGTELWRMVVDGSVWPDYSVGDINGDGLTDIILETRNYTTQTSHVIALRGTDGYELWNKSFNGDIRSYPAGDLNGDGLTDVVIDIADQVIALRGNDGHELWRKTVTGARWRRSIIPTEDLNGDGMDDVVISNQSEDEGHAEVSAVEGNNGSVLWVKAISGEKVRMTVSQHTEDFNEDGIIDVLLFAQTYGKGIYSYQAIAVRGNDGYEEWVADLGGSDEEYYPRAILVEDTTGDGIKDILVEAGSSSSSRSGGHLLAIRGTDGYSEWDTTICVECSWEAHPAGDLNGDEMADVLVRTYYDTYNYWILAIKGTNGQYLWGKKSSECRIYPAGDLNDDGTDDVVIYEELGISVVKGINGDELWRAESVDRIWIGEEKWYDDSFLMGADLNSDGINEVIIGTYGTMYALTTVPITETEITFDTGEGSYPSIMGTHNGTIKPSNNIIVNTLYTYPCPGTGGHSEYVRIHNESGTLAKGYRDKNQSDYRNIALTPSIKLLKGHEYNYTIITGSYPQIIHKQNHTTLDGSLITCSEFIDANGNKYNNWIPAVRLE